MGILTAGREEFQYESICNSIQTEITSMQNSYVAIGFYLKQARDTELFVQGEYSSVWEFAADKFGISKSAASRFMAINDKFSVNGNSIELLEEYKGFGSSKLSEMLTLSDEQIENVTVATTVAQIREIKRESKQEDEQLPGQMDIKEYPGVVPEYDEVESEASKDVVEQWQQMTQKDNVETSQHQVNNTLETTFKPFKEEEVVQAEIIEPTKGLNTSSDDISQNEKNDNSENCDNNCFYCKDTTCNSYQDKRINCLVDNSKLCSLYGAHEVAISNGIKCNQSCCKLCKEDCMARCNQSHNSQDELEQQEYSYEEISAYTTQDVDDKVAALENNVAQYKYEKCTMRQVRYEQMRLDALYALKSNLKGEWVPVIDNDQPPLPVLKNDDQRKEWLNRYKDWGTWFKNNTIGVIYYKYDFPDGSRIVVERYKEERYHSSYRMQEDGYGFAIYHLIKKNQGFNHYGNNTGELVEHLKAVVPRK